MAEIKLAPRERKQSYANMVAKELQNAILAGVFEPGKKLPGQRELAGQFETSLPTLREAIGILAATGMIEVRHGSGTIVRGTSESNAALKGWLGMAINEKERVDFLEVRILIENFIVERIIARKRDVDFGPMKAALARMEAGMGSPEEYLEADLKFHWEMAKCSGNSVLVRLVDALQLPMRQQINDAISEHLGKSGGLTRSYKKHVTLLDALQRGSLEQARRTIVRMIDRPRRSPAAETAVKAVSD